MIGFVVFIACVVALAAGITWLVVRISPTPGAKEKKAEEAAEAG